MNASGLFTSTRLVPVVAIEDQAVAVDLALALRDAGLGAIEVTLRTRAALPAIEMIANKVPDIMVGAGSIRQPEHFEEIVSRGAKFAVSPGCSSLLLEAAMRVQLPFVPGAETASEMLVLMQHGYELQKYFPAEQSGGISRLKAISAPLPEIMFFPTGGINAALAPVYLSQSFVQCVGGSWFVSAEKLAASDFEGVRREAETALALCLHG